MQKLSINKSTWKKQQQQQHLKGNIVTTYVRGLCESIKAFVVSVTSTHILVTIGLSRTYLYPQGQGSHTAPK